MRTLFPRQPNICFAAPVGLSIWEEKATFLSLFFLYDPFRNLFGSFSNDCKFKFPELCLTSCVHDLGQESEGHALICNDRDNSFELDRFVKLGDLLSLGGCFFQFFEQRHDQIGLSLFVFLQSGINATILEGTHFFTIHEDRFCGHTQCGGVLELKLRVRLGKSAFFCLRYVNIGLANPVFSLPPSWQDQKHHCHHCLMTPL